MPRMLSSWRSIRGHQHAAAAGVAGRARSPRDARLVLALALSMCALLPAGAHAQVRGLIVGPGETAFPIAVSPLRSQEQSADLGERFADTVSRDLDLSGLFRILDRSSF